MKKKDPITRTLDSLIPSRHTFRKKLIENTRESLSSILPISLLVIILSFLFIPVELSTMSLFVVGALLMLLGMGLFNLGADSAMLPMGSHLGGRITRSRNIIFISVCALLLGILITLAEPDLSVLASQISGVSSPVLILTVAIGVGLFLVAALLRILFGIRLSLVLFILYGIVFLLSIFIPPENLGLCFDSGGVTTGPITVPFILALGVGVSNVRGGKQAQDDSFGLVSLCSIGPILAVEILCLLCPGLTASVSDTGISAGLLTTRDLTQGFLSLSPGYLTEVLIALSPITLFFIVFQFLFLHLPGKELKKIGVGVLYTYLGLVLFLLGVNAGFLPMGQVIGSSIAKSGNLRYALIPLGMLMGYLAVRAEPAVHVLNAQVEQITSGAVSRNAMMRTLSLGVSVSVGLSMLRVLTGLSLMWFILPGYAIALILTFFVDPVFTAIAFDSGGVASGPLTAAFMLPMAMGACDALGGNILDSAFGLVALVAMTPLIAIQTLGVIYRIKTRTRPESSPAVPEDDEIIDI